MVEKTKDMSAQNVSLLFASIFHRLGHLLYLRRKRVGV